MAVAVGMQADWLPARTIVERDSLNLFF